MTPVQPKQTVRQLAIAALLGAIPTFAVAQGPKAPTSVSAAGNEGGDAAAERVPVAARDIARGAALTATDIGYAPRSAVAERSGSKAAPDSIEPAAAGDQLVGWTTRRVVTAGEPLRPPTVIAPQLVRSGDLVEVVWGQDGILVTMRGRATRSAAVGERIAVRMDAQRKLEGTVIAAGRVRVN
jgi:flagella basal body P-ring formation protein FlgA